MVEPAGEDAQTSEQELREQLEQQVRELRVDDLILQSAVSVLNLAARRIAKPDERDLDQAKAGIEAVGALLDYVPEQARPQLRQAVSELQLLWAKQASGGDEAGGDEAGGDDGGGDEAGGEQAGSGEQAGAGGKGRGADGAVGAEESDAEAGGGRDPAPDAEAPPEQRKKGERSRSSGLWIPGDG